MPSPDSVVLTPGSLVPKMAILGRLVS